MRAHLDALAPGELNKPDAQTSHTLLEAAAAAGAVKIAKLLLSRGATGSHPLGAALYPNGDNVVAMCRLLLAAGHKPTKYNWASAVASGRPPLLRLFLTTAKPPPRAQLAAHLQAARNLLAAKRTVGRQRIVRMLEKLVGSLL